MMVNQELREFDPSGPVKEQAQQAWMILAGTVMNHKGPGAIRTLTYGELAEKMGRPLRYARSLGAPLSVIGRFCIRHNLPPLNVIVVSKDTGKPGHRVVLRPGSTIEKDQEDVMKHDWYRYPVPNLLKVTLAILGWGSLIWDTESGKGKAFDRWRVSEWEVARNLELPIEFSRISRSRDGALTLVIDEDHGRDCPVQYALSRRDHLEDAVCDLKRREGTLWKNIGYWSAKGDRSGHRLSDRIGRWATENGIDAVVWTALESNFEQCKKVDFTVEHAIQHLEVLSPKAKLEAREYICRTPREVRTELRTALETKHWL